MPGPVIRQLNAADAEPIAAAFEALGWPAATAAPGAEVRVDDDLALMMTRKLR